MLLCVTANKYMVKVKTGISDGWEAVRDHVLQCAGLLETSEISGGTAGSVAGSPVAAIEAAGAGAGALDASSAKAGPKASADPKRPAAAYVPPPASPTMSPAAHSKQPPSSGGGGVGGTGVPEVLDLWTQHQSDHLITPLMHLKPMRARGMDDSSRPQPMHNKAGRAGSNEVYPTHHPGPISCVTTCIWKDMIATAGGGPKDHSVRLWSISNHSLLE
jgi:hypothetical protein